MDYMDLAVHCPQKAVKSDCSLTHIMCRILIYYINFLEFSWKRFPIIYNKT